MISNTHQQSIFDDNASKWWDSSGPMQSLHALMPARLEYLEMLLRRYIYPEHAQSPGRGLFGKGGQAVDCESHEELDPSALWRNISVLDIGCGGGLMSEALAIRGATVTGCDTSAALIDQAVKHAAAGGVKVTYTTTPVAKLKAQGSFDLVLLLEVLEHVHPSERVSMLQDVASCLRPQGLLVLSTLNKSRKTKFLAVDLAESVLRWLPIGTHDPAWFIRPVECSDMMRQVGLRPAHFQSVSWRPRRGWQLKTEKNPVNYFFCATKA